MVFRTYRAINLKLEPREKHTSVDTNLFETASLSQISFCRKHDILCYSLTTIRPESSRDTVLINNLYKTNAKMCKQAAS